MEKVKFKPELLQKRLNDLLPDHAHSLRGVRVGKKPRAVITKATVTTIQQVDPTDLGALTAYNFPLWGPSPGLADINQRTLADCYFLACLGAIVQYPKGLAYLQTILRLDPVNPAKVIASYFRFGAQTNVECDLLVSGSENTFDSVNQDLWVEIFEKTYAYFRSGADTFHSLDYGNFSPVASDLGCDPSGIKMIGSDVFSYIRTSLANQVPLGAPTPPSPGLGLIGSHEYTITGIDAANNVTVRNPWGNYFANPYSVIAPSDFVDTNFQCLEYGAIPVVQAQAAVTYTQDQLDAAVAAAVANEKTKIRNLLATVNGDLK